MKEKRWKDGAKIGAVAVLLLLLVGGVFAASEQSNPTKQSPEAIKSVIAQLAKSGGTANDMFNNLSPEMKKEVVKNLKTSKVVTSISPTEKGLSLQSSGCRYLQVTRSGQNALGQTLWSYFQKIDWCYDGSKITSKTRLRWGEVYFPFWQFAGHIGNLEQGGVNQWSYRAWTQGEFKLCIGGDIGCVQYAYPWIDMTVYGNGASTYSSGG